MVAREVPARHIGYSFCVNTDESTGVKSLGGHFVVLVALCGVGCTQDVNFCFRAVDDIRNLINVKHERDSRLLST